MNSKVSKIVMQQTIMMGLFYTGLFLVIEGFLFGEVASLLTAVFTFFKSESLMSQFIIGVSFLIIGGIVTGLSLLVAYWLYHRNEFDTDENISKLCRPFIAIFSAILSFATSIYIIYFLYQHELV